MSRSALEAWGAAPATQIADVLRRSSSSSASEQPSSSLRWNHNPHPIPQPVAPELHVPAHDIEDGLPEVDVWLRSQGGTSFCTKLRRTGVTPCELSSLPGNTSVKLAMHSKDAARLVRHYGRNGLQAQVLRVNVYEQPPPPPAPEQQEQQAPQASGSRSSRSPQQPQQQQRGAHPAASPATASASSGDSSSNSGSSSPGPSSSSGSGGSGAARPLAAVRVLPKAVHINSVTQDVENFTLMFCPADRTVTLNIPVRLWNDDIAPGVRGGAWLHVVNRTVRVRARGGAIQPYLQLDMRHMRARDVVRYRDVPLPPGCVLVAKDPSQPVVRCAVRVGGD